MMGKNQLFDYYITILLLVKICSNLILFFSSGSENFELNGPDERLSLSDHSDKYSHIFMYGNENGDILSGKIRPLHQGTAINLVGYVKYLTELYLVRFSSVSTTDNATRTSTTRSSVLLNSYVEESANVIGVTNKSGRDYM